MHNRNTSRIHYFLHWSSLGPDMDCLCSPDAPRVSPDARRFFPDARRVSPDARRFSPDARRVSPHSFPTWLRPCPHHTAPLWWRGCWEMWEDSWLLPIHLKTLRSGRWSSGPDPFCWGMMVELTPGFGLRDVRGVLQKGPLLRKKTQNGILRGRSNRLHFIPFKSYCCLFKQHKWLI